VLVVTPSPKPDESLNGYLTRVIESNGYHTLGTILSIANIDDKSGRGLSLDLNSISKILGGIDLESISYPFLSATIFFKETYKKEVSYLKRCKGFWKLKSQSFCPWCVERDGYIKQHFDLSSVVACHRHQIWLISNCENCGKHVNPHRSHLLSCRCGYNYLNSKQRRAPEHTLELMRIVENAYYGHTEHPIVLDGNDEKAPINNMEIYDLFKIFELISKSFPYSKLSNHGLQPTEFFSEVFFNWPKNFFQFLESVGTYSIYQNGHLWALKDQYKFLYTRLVHHARRSEVFEVFLQAFFVFGAQHWGKNFIDSRLDNKFLKGSYKRYMSVAEASRYSSIDSRRIRAWCKSGALTCFTHTSEGGDKYVIDTDSKILEAGGDSNKISLRKAAAYVGIPASMFVALKGMGVLGSKYSESNRRGYHVEDISALKSELLAKAELVKEEQIDFDSSYSVDFILTHKAFRVDFGNAKFLINYIEGRITPIGRIDASVKSIYFSKSDVDRLLMNEFRSSSVKEVAQVVKIDQEILKLLHSDGYIDGSFHTRCFLRLDMESAKQFKSRYVLIHQVAKEYSTSVFKIKKLCKANFQDIDLLSVTRANGSSFNFISNSDAKKLKRYLELSGYHSSYKE